jgi:hypothetical protein
MRRMRFARAIVITSLMVAAACGPKAAPAGNAPLVDWKRECDTFYTLAERYGACDKAPAEPRAGVRENAATHRTNLGQIDVSQARPEEKQQLAGECRGYANQIREALAQAGC